MSTYFGEPEDPILTACSLRKFSNPRIAGIDFGLIRKCESRGGHRRGNLIFQYRRELNDIFPRGGLQCWCWVGGRMWVEDTERRARRRRACWAGWKKREEGRGRGIRGCVQSVSFCLSIAPLLVIHLRCLDRPSLIFRQQFPGLAQQSVDVDSLSSGLTGEFGAHGSGEEAVCLPGALWSVLVRFCLVFLPFVCCWFCFRYFRLLCHWLVPPVLNGLNTIFGICDRCRLVRSGCLHSRHHVAQDVFRDFARCIVPHNGFLFFLFFFYLCLVFVFFSLVVPCGKGDFHISVSGREARTRAPIASK